MSSAVPRSARTPGVRYGVDHLAPFATGGDQATPTQTPQMRRDATLWSANCLHQCSDGLLSLQEEVEQSQARGISQSAKEPGEELSLR